MPANFEKPITLTREELYAQVWAIPISQLAAQYGLSGRGLGKICARHLIPCPPRGYWAKKAAGQPVVQFRLPEPNANTPSKVTITPTPPSPIPTKAEGELGKQIETAREAHSALVVPGRLRRPHPVIVGWLAEHQREAQEAKRQRDPSLRRLMEPQDFTKTDQRMHRFLDTLFKALEGLGFIIKEEQYQPVHLEIQKERVDFQLREKQKQVRRPLTEDEKRWSFHRDRGWMQELHPTGILIFTIKTHISVGMRHEWKDESDRPLETCLPEIVATLSLAGPILVKRRQEREEAEKRQREEEYQRYLERRDREQDLKRWKCFLQLAHQCEQAAGARRLVVELEMRLQDENETFGNLTARQWLNWCRRWLDRYDPLQRRPVQEGMSALSPRADMCSATRDVRFWDRFRRRSHDRVEQRRSAPRSLRRWPLHRFESRPFLAAPA